MAADKVIELEPENGAMYHLKGSAFENKGRTIEAIECYERAVEINSDDFDKYFDLAGHFVQVGKKKKPPKHVKTLET
jgi:tetratricopeptide (TPR) repeat protein